MRNPESKFERILHKKEIKTEKLINYSSNEKHSKLISGQFDPTISAALLGLGSYGIAGRLRDDVVTPRPGREPGDFQKVNEQLAQENTKVKAENERLKAQNTHLSATAQQAEIAASNARTTAQRLTWQNKRLQNENTRLSDAVKHWQDKAQKAEAKAVDLLDPKGYCKALGIDPQLLRTLPAEKLDRLITQVYRAYSMVHHPDLGGDTVAMKAVNAAYDFLKDPLNRTRYGR